MAKEEAESHGSSSDPVSNVMQITASPHDTNWTNIRVPAHSASIADRDRSIHFSMRAVELSEQCLRSGWLPKMDCGVDALRC